jgi:glycosyltransferase involved in cell wall biosynthesis
MISVALCTYNGEKFLEEQIQSILSQTLPVDEIIICDDCSTDKTNDILEKYRKIDTRIKIFRNKKNLGTIKNFEKAIYLTSGDIIFLADQDDIWNEDKVRKMINFFTNEPKCLFLFTNANLIDNRGNLLDKTLWDKWNFDSNVKEKWLDNKNAIIDLINNHNKVTGATVAFKSILKKYVLPIKTPKAYWHDAWIAMHAAYYNGLFFLDEVTIKYRIHEQQQVGELEGGRITDKFYISNKVFNRHIRKKFPEFTAYFLPLKNSFFKRLIGKFLRIIKLND